MSRASGQAALRQPRGPASGRRLLRIAAEIMGINLRARMEYRADFALEVVFGVVYHIAALAFVWVVVARFTGLADWTLNQVLFVVGIRLLAHGVFETVFGNLGWFTEMIRDGSFDRMLVRPIHPLTQVLLSQFRINGLGDLLVGVAVFAVAEQALSLSWSLIGVVYLGLVLVGSVLLEAGLFLVLTTVSFWTVKSEGLLWWAGDVINTFGNYPLTIFPPSARYLFTFAFPIGFLAFFPASVFLGRAGEVPFSPLLAYGAPLIGGLVFVVGFRLWEIGLRHHQSTGT